MRHSANYTNYLKSRRQALDESALSSSRRASLASRPISPPAFISERSTILACVPLSSATRGVPAQTFEIVKRFHESMPDDIRPSVSTSNAESLLFDRLDSGYIVSVASNEGTG